MGRKGVWEGQRILWRGWTRFENRERLFVYRWVRWIQIRDTGVLCIVSRTCIGIGLEYKLPNTHTVLLPWFGSCSLIYLM